MTTVLVILAVGVVVILAVATGVLLSTRQPTGPVYHPPEPPELPGATQGPERARWTEEEDLTDPEGWHGYRRRTLEAEGTRTAGLLVSGTTNQLLPPHRP